MSTRTSGSEHLRQRAASVSRIAKQRHLLKLSEDEFRDLVVRPLFLRQGLEDGRETCGVSEYGKDCYFVRNSALGGTDIIVVQTKKGKITLASTPSANLATIVTQLKTALETSIPLIADKKRRKPIEAFLVASGEINDAAQRHIVAEVKDPRLKFVDIEALIPLIDQFLPELWLGIDSDAISYMRALSQAMENGSELLSGGVQLTTDNSNSVLDDVYANVHVLRARSKREVKGKKLLPKRQRVSELQSSLPITSLPHEKDHLLLVVGAGGAGKSTALKRIAYELALKPVESPSQIKIPILLRARDLTDLPSATLLDHALHRVQILLGGKKQPFSADDLEQGRVVFLIDGLDEVAKAESMDAALDTISAFHSKFPLCKIILTSRPTPYLRSGAFLKSFTPFTITDLNLAQAAKIVRALARQKSLSVENSSEILRQLQQVHGVTLNPLIVTVFMASSDFSKQDIPPNITELFKKYTELMLGRWDEGKKLQQQIQAPVKDLVLRQVAFRMHGLRQTAIAIEEFQGMIYEELMKRGFQEEMPLLFHEIVERSGLFRVESDQIEFRHHLFQEFFAGRAIPGLDFIRGVIDSDWWKRAIVFYFGEHPDETASLIELASATPAPTGERAFVSATTIGLALQACYFAPIEDKARVYELVIRSIITSMQDPEFSEFLKELPFIRLVYSFFMARESLALTNLKLFVSSLHKALLERYTGTPQLEEMQFWLIVGLLQSGLYELAVPFVKEFKTNDPGLLFTLRTEIKLNSLVRVISNGAEDQLKALLKIVDQRFTPMIGEMRRLLDQESKKIDQMAVEVTAEHQTSLPPIPKEVDGNSELSN
jgi:NACHT domain/Restriction endonuclease